MHRDIVGQQRARRITGHTAHHPVLQPRRRHLPAGLLLVLHQILQLRIDARHGQDVIHVAGRLCLRCLLGSGRQGTGQHQGNQGDSVFQAAGHVNAPQWSVKLCR